MIDSDAAIEAMCADPAEGRWVGARPIKRVSYTHDAMIDLLIASPGITQNAIASHFGYTPSWVSTVMHSDAFQARLALRREQIIDPAIRLSTEERFRAVTNRSLEVLQEKLSRDAGSIPDNLVLRAVELGAKALGIGGNAPPPSVPTDHLAGLADRLMLLQSGVRKGIVYDQSIETVEVISPREQDGSERREGPSAPRADSIEAHSYAQVHGGGEVLNESAPS